MEANLNIPPSGAIRWISRYIDGPNAALFPFGLGLFYTQFGYLDVTLSRESLPVREAVPGTKTLVIVKATVTNNGKISATEVANCGHKPRATGPQLKGLQRLHAGDAGARRIAGDQFPLGSEELPFLIMAVIKSSNRAYITSGLEAIRSRTNEANLTSFHDTE